MLRPSAVAVAVAALCAGCDDFPRDPRDTSERAIGGTVRVGVADNPPWTRAAEPPAGVEVELVRRFAEGIGADIEWRFGAESELLERLKRFDLAIVIAGLTADTPWKGRVATTLPYLSADTDGDTKKERRVMAVPPGENGWLLRLDRYLHAHQQEALRLLAEAMP